MATYSNSSPYLETTQFNNELDILNMRTIPNEDDDPSYTIMKKYEHRPDLLAFDLYGNVGLWWVFVNRNRDIIKDPIWDFTAGTIIRLPTRNTVTTALGL